MGEKIKDDGGAAFGEFKQAGDLAIKTDGISIRDYFAAKALPGLMGRSWSPLTGDELVNQWAVSAYAMADAMLAERAK